MRWSDTIDAVSLPVSSKQGFSVNALTRTKRACLITIGYTRRSHSGYSLYIMHLPCENYSLKTVNKGRKQL